MRVNTMKGAAAGAILAYLLDPALGRDRRAALAHRMADFSREMMASRQERRLASPGASGEIAVAPPAARRAFLRRRRPRTSRPQGWDHPMATVQIDVDGRYAMPGAEAMPARSMRAPHRGFTRTSRGVYWKIGEPGMMPRG